MSNRHKAVLPGVESSVVNPSLPVALESGHFVSARVVRLIEIIRERWPILEVKWIPKEMRGPNDDAFLIVERAVDGREFPVFRIKDEQDFDGSIIERLLLSDNKEHNVHDFIEARNEAVRLVQQKLIEDEREERKDIMNHAIRSHKHGYTFKNEKDEIINVDVHGGKILRGER